MSSNQLPDAPWPQLSLPALITRPQADGARWIVRRRVMAFVADFWLTIRLYSPIAHMVWAGGGFALRGRRPLDLRRGHPWSISLPGFRAGARLPAPASVRGFPSEPMRPHSTDDDIWWGDWPLLWVGWFRVQRGSAGASLSSIGSGGAGDDQYLIVATSGWRPRLGV